MSRYAIITFILFMMSLPAYAHVFCGESVYDGTHKNEIEGYLQGGDNNVTGFFLGPTVSYKRHFTPRWSVKGAIDAPFGKKKFGIYAEGAYRLPVRKFNFYFSAKFMYNRYGGFGTNEYNGNLSIKWEAPYFEVVVGESLISYNLLKSTYTEPFTFTFGAGVNIRPRWNSWNIGLFFRNYDDFYYENWNINWGIRWMANLPLRMKLYGELNIRPAGSMSQLATRYETSAKVGIKYTW